ncbi:DUF2935 domain-containing protein [Sporosarcina siberiensis]|uniref:DUF2935 domain-containing protein n=1 Tax=Sporosarcina siberiensis TaxID=1365606 RepID=A0ABW4SDN8_9BACL
MVLPYTDNYERDTYGIIDFWVRNNFEHGEFFDREISHHELELARTNHEMVQRMGKIFNRAEKKTVDIGLLLDEAKSSTREFRELLLHTMDKSLKCEVIISTPVSLLDHMIREAEEAEKVFKLVETGTYISPSDATIHESNFWLRQMLDHLIFISHYVDASNYQLHDEVRAMTKKFENYFLQANSLKTIIRRPRGEVSPVLNTFNQMIIKEAKALEAFKLELSVLIKNCAAVTTAPPNLLEHIAREAHHLWKNLEDQVVN